MLTERYRSALQFAATLHDTHLRKGTEIAYLSHLISVSALVMENAGSETEAIAALLHDAIEDGGAVFPGGVTALRLHLRADFGERVLAIVEGCTDAETVPKPPYRERKERYIAHLEHVAPEVLLVSCADKLHNARAIVADLRIMGETLFARFNGGRDGTLRYYEALAEVFDRRGPEHLAAELGRTVETMKEMAG